MVANNQNQAKRTKRKGNAKWVKGMTSPNPNGAPRRGQSWSELVNEVGEMTGEEAAREAAAVASQLRSLGNTVTLKRAVVIRAYADLLFDPKAAMLLALMDRAEGKPGQSIEVNMTNDERLRALGMEPEETRKYIRAAMAALLAEKRADNSA